MTNQSYSGSGNVIVASYTVAKPRQRLDARIRMGDLPLELAANASSILALYRDWSDPGVAELKVLKNRYGPTPLCRLAFHEQKKLFANIYRGDE